MNTGVCLKGWAVSHATAVKMGPLAECATRLVTTGYSRMLRVATYSM